MGDNPPRSCRPLGRPGETWSTMSRPSQTPRLCRKILLDITPSQTPRLCHVLYKVLEGGVCPRATMSVPHPNMSSVCPTWLFRLSKKEDTCFCKGCGGWWHIERWKDLLEWDRPCQKVWSPMARSDRPCGGKACSTMKYPGRVSHGLRLFHHNCHALVESCPGRLTPQKQPPLSPSAIQTS